MIHSRTRKRDLVDKLFSLGLCISYDQVLNISTGLGNADCAQYTTEEVVCPLQLRRGLFTTSAIDNIDHNPSSTGCQTSFHGTGISLFQHPSSENPGEQRGIQTQVDFSGKSPMTPLPEVYSIVPPVAIQRQDPSIPKFDGPQISNCLLFPEALKAEYR